MAYARTLSTTDAFESVLGAAQAGAEWAWAEIYGDLAGPVTGYLRSRGAPDADDLCSETFLHVARGIADFEGSYDSFRSWVFVIAHRRLIDARRAASRRPRTVSDDDHLRLVPDEAETDAEALGRLSTDQMMTAFEALTEDQRDVLALRVIADLSVQHTAEVMGKRPGAIKALQRRALAAVKKSLESSGVSE